MPSWMQQPAAPEEPEMPSWMKQNMPKKPEPQQSSWMDQPSSMPGLELPPWATQTQKPKAPEPQKQLPSQHIWGSMDAVRTRLNLNDENVLNNWNPSGVSSSSLNKHLSPHMSGSFVQDGANLKGRGQAQAPWAVPDGSMHQNGRQQQMEGPYGLRMREEPSPFAKASMFMEDDEDDMFSLWGDYDEEYGDEYGMDGYYDDYGEDYGSYYDEYGYYDDYGEDDYGDMWGNDSWDDYGEDDYGDMWGDDSMWGDYGEDDYYEDYGDYGDDYGWEDYGDYGDDYGDYYDDYGDYGDYGWDDYGADEDYGWEGGDSNWW